MAAAGDTIPFSIDLVSFGALDWVIFRVFNPSSFDAFVKFKYPIAEGETGYDTITKTGTVYSFKISAAKSATMVGNWAVDFEYKQTGVDQRKTGYKGTLSIEQSSK